MNFFASVIVIVAVVALLSNVTGLSFGTVLLIVSIVYALSIQTSGSQSAAPPPQQRPQASRAKIEAYQQELFSLVRGDRRLAQRLLNQCQRDYPGNDPAWYFEKVIHDLVRDRR